VPSPRSYRTEVAFTEVSATWMPIEPEPPWEVTVKFATGGYCSVGTGVGATGSVTLMQSSIVFTSVPFEPIA